MIPAVKDTVSNCDSTVVVAIKDHIFKKPLQPAPRKKKVLDEETYVKKLEDIIERDFFPDLDNLKDKLEYLEASEINDVSKLREIYMKYSDGSGRPMPVNPADSPATFDTPVASSGEKPAKTPLRNVDSDILIGKQNANQNEDLPSDILKPNQPEEILSLDQFMALYTSEDNESFEQVMEDQDHKFRLKHPWLFEAEERHNALHAPNLALPSIEEQKQAKILALTGTSDNEKDTRPCSLENWSYKTFNSVMFVPEGAPFSKNQSIERAKIKQREVSHENSRFQENPFNEALSQATMLEASAIQAYKKEGKVGVDGKELRESPKVNGYSYVRTPSPAPGVDCSPLMTWGQIEGTPFQLDGSQTPLIKGKGTQGPSYKIPKVSDRDELLIKLAEKVSQNHRDRKSKAHSAARSSLASPSGRISQSSCSERLSSMSPAAQKLFTSKLGVNRGTDRALRASYTPSPVTRSAGLPATPMNVLTPSTRTLGTPIVSSKATKRPFTPSITDSIGLTDNLLNLPTRLSGSSPCKLTPKRKCASDFF